ncbi:MAG: hypothetical protein V3T29_03275 [Alphaproteobacteria bacterium]
MIRLALALVLAAAPLSSAGAQGLGPAGELAGSYRNLFAVTRDSRDKVILTDFNRLRLSLQGAAGAWSWRITYDHELAAGGFVESPDFAPVEAIPEPTALDATDAIAGGERFEWRQRLYRAVLAYDWGGGQLSVGRQRIAWGSGRLWNPTDRFNPVAPTAIEPEEKTGVDSLTGELRFGQFGALQGVAAPEREGRNVRRKLALRWRDTVGELDYALLGGRIGDETVLGLDLAANLWQGGIRLEALVGRPETGGRYAQLAAGYDYTLATALFPAGLYLLAEYFYNGAALGGPLPLLPSDRLESRNGHFLGLSAGYDLTPLWRLDGLVIWDLTGSSLFFSPQLTWSASAAIDVSLFAQVFAGDRTSEFGAFENAIFLRLELFF